MNQPAGPLSGRLGLGRLQGPVADLEPGQFTIHEGEHPIPIGDGASVVNADLRPSQQVLLLIDNEPKDHASDCGGELKGVGHQFSPNLGGHHWPVDESNVAHRA